jgi:hypothetical protein
VYVAKYPPPQERRSMCPCKISQPPAGMEKNTDTDKPPHMTQNREKTRKKTREKTTYREKIFRFIQSTGHSY